jgi:hypothetical protein
MHRTFRTTVIVALAAALATACGTDSGDTAEGTTSTASASVSESPTVAPAERSPIDGEYRMTLTKQDVLAAGLPRSLAGQVAGAWRVTFSFEYAQQFVNVGGANGVTSDGYQGGFSVEGNELTLTQDPPLTFRWRLDGKRLTLHLEDPGSADPVDALIWTIHPWESFGG